MCPHCWEVNVLATPLCERCGADMRLILQESGGARRTAPVQSPIPVRVLRLSTLQRLLLLCFLLLMFAMHVIGTLYASARRLAPPTGRAAPVAPLPSPAGLD